MIKMLVHVIKQMIGIITIATETILLLLYPSSCPFCGKPLKGSEEDICNKCFPKLPYIDEPRCMQCGKPIQNDTKEYCRDCLHTHHYYERGFAVWSHQPIVALAIYKFKYHNRRIYSRVFAREMVRCCGSKIQRWNVGLIVPIPISRKRRRERGYNQTELLAKEISRLTGIPMAANSLKRIKDTTPQKKLSVRGRRQNLQHAFVWEDMRIPPANVLIIDDIYTTGNTIDSAAKVLRKAGAKKVYFLTVSIGQGF